MMTNESSRPTAVSRSWPLLLAVFGMAQGFPASLAAQSSEGDAAEAEVIAVVQQLLDAISVRDTAAYRALVLSEVRSLIVVPESDSLVYYWRGTEESIRQLGGGGPRLLERMWEAQARVSGPIATVWAPYDFYRDGRFSHCGVDAFHLVETPAGWRIAGIMYTVIRSQARCPASPLGPPPGPS